MEGGYPIAAEALDLEVYVLAALLAGSSDLAAMEPDMPFIRRSRHTFEASEISRRLISLAVMLRSILDAPPREPEHTVGRLVPDITDPACEKDLSLREACNKIIHAQDIDLAPGRWEETECPPASRIVFLHGTHGNRDWTARLDTLAFLDAASPQF